MASLGAQLVRLLAQPAGLAVGGLGDLGGLLLRRRLQGRGLLLRGGADLLARRGRLGHNLVGLPLDLVRAGLLLLERALGLLGGLGGLLELLLLGLEVLLEVLDLGLELALLAEVEDERLVERRLGRVRMKVEW